MARWTSWTIAAFALAVVTGSSGWVLTDRLEQDNAFCVSCHLDPDRALHADNRRDFDARPPEALAPAHAAAGHPDDRPFRCIDCHGGTGFLGRGRVKWLSARDAFWYVVGRFEEPEGMHWPIEDQDCVVCHDAFDPPVREAWQAPAFHALAVHNNAFEVSCVTCHGAHERGGLTGSHFLQPASVRAACATCHSEFEGELEP